MRLRIHGGSGKKMKTILWWVGLPLRLAVGLVVLIVLALVIPKDLKEVLQMAVSIIKGKMP